MTAATSTVSVELGDGELVVAEVKRSPRARVTRIQLGADRPLRIIVPEGVSDQFAIEALLAKRTWVRRKLEEVASDDQLNATPRPSVVPNRPANLRQFVKQLTVNHGYFVNDENLGL